jgi:hypothetical protein
LEFHNLYTVNYCIYSRLSEIVEPRVNRELTKEFEGIERIPTTMNKALKQWQEKKEYLEEQLGIISDPSQKHTLRKQIEECEQELARFSNKANHSFIGQNSPQPTSINSNKLSGKDLQKLRNAFLDAFDLQTIKVTVHGGSKTI